MKTIISHFFNEEYLLPWWLKHHKNFFDNGIMIDYHSTDSSVSIIKEICPNWKIINTKNEFFDAEKVDNEIYEIEKYITGWRIILNTTEFLLGHYHKLDTYHSNELFIPSYTMIDNICNKNILLDNNISLIKQKFYGAYYDPRWPKHHKPRQRKLSNYAHKHPIGRHYNNKKINKDFIILWYGYSPYNENLINRKLQIQNQIPDTDKKLGRGRQHIITYEEIEKKINYLQKYRIDLSELIKNFMNN